jgi:hypothetical protein
MSKQIQPIEQKMNDNDCSQKCINYIDNLCALR